jgi:hypothetical protein
MTEEREFGAEGLGVSSGTKKPWQRLWLFLLESVSSVKFYP